MKKIKVKKHENFQELKGRSYISSILALMMTLSILTVLSLRFAAATTWNVPADFPTIQGGISDPNVVNGDTIVVEEGTYYENISFLGKSITVKSTIIIDPNVMDDPNVVMSIIDNTIINGNHFLKLPTVSFLNSESANARLIGFTICGANDADGGGIFIDRSSPLILACKIVNNTANNGAGIFINNSMGQESLLIIFLFP